MFNSPANDRPDVLNYTGSAAAVVYRLCNTEQGPIRAMTRGDMDCGVRIFG